jgi:G3E family GTPase
MKGVKTLGKLKFATVVQNGNVYISDAETPTQHFDSVIVESHGVSHPCAVVHEFFEIMDGERNFDRLKRAYDSLKDRNITVL